MSLCDTCIEPGRCCRSFTLSFRDQDLVTPLEILAKVAAYGAPFMPLYRNRRGFYRFWCPDLTREGRCGNYAGRPDTRSAYRPASDPLCAHYGHACAHGFMPAVDGAVLKEDA